MLLGDFKSLFDLVKYFSTEEKCREYLEQFRWNGEPTCPHCGCTRVYRVKNGNRYRCSDKGCYKKFSVLVGTIFENTKIPLSKWFMSIYVCLSHKTGISSVQLSKDIGVCQKTGWFMLHRIREMMSDDCILSGTIEVDETYIGGQDKYKSRSKRKIYDGTGYVNKVPVFGMLQRDGKVILKVVEKNPNGNVLKPIIRNYVSEDSVIISDGFGGYTGLKKEFKGHEVVNHTQGEYVRYEGKNVYHTNGIEGVFSNLKRGIIGIYRQTSEKHLHRYCNEFSYRFNTRKMTDSERFRLKMLNIEGRLTFNNLISDN